MIKYTEMEILLEGLGQDVAPTARPMGKLDVAKNVESRDVDGGRSALCKTRGYRFVDLDQTISRFSNDVLFTRIVNHDGRLIVFTFDYVAEIGDRGAVMRGTDSNVYRGPANRGNISMRVIAVSRTSRNVIP